MSIVAYYGRFTPSQIEECAATPEALSSGAIDHLAGAEIIDIDRSYAPMAWLLSPCKRAEDEHNALMMQEYFKEKYAPKPSLLSKVTGFFAKKHETIEEPQPTKKIDVLPLDPPLIAIEGRTEKRDERFDFGLGAAAIFSPEEVIMLNDALASLTKENLEQHYNPEIMDEQNIFPVQWMEEGRDLMETYVLPNFLQLQSFYSSAVKNNQAVLIWYV